MHSVRSSESAAVCLISGANMLEKPALFLASEREEESEAEVFGESP